MHKAYRSHAEEQVSLPEKEPVARQLHALLAMHVTGNRPVAAETLLKLAVKWASASDEPAAQSRSCTLYSVRGRREASKDHADLNLLLY